VATPTPAPVPKALPLPIPFDPAVKGKAPIGAGAVVTQMDHSKNNLTINSGVYVVGDNNGTTINIDKNGAVKKISVQDPVGDSDRGRRDDDESSSGKFSKGKATLVEVGSNVDTGIYWGRWEGKPGKGDNIPADQSHVMYSTHVTNAAELSLLKAVATGPNANPQVVNATYKYVGGTSPTRSDGAVGTVNSMTVKANFSSQMITAYDVNLQFDKGNAAQKWDAHLDPAKATNASFANFSGAGAGIGLTGTCSNCSNGTVIEGSAKGIFTGNDARGLMTTYDLKNGAGGATVTGAAALKR
jgi:hypothetical protein